MWQEQVSHKLACADSQRLSVKFSWKWPCGKHSFRCPSAAGPGLLTLAMLLMESHLAEKQAPAHFQHKEKPEENIRERDVRGHLSRMSADDPRFTYGCVWPLIIPSSPSSPCVLPSRSGRRPLRVWFRLFWKVTVNQACIGRALKMYFSFVV